MPEAPMFQQLAAGYAPLAGGVPNPYRTGLEGLPLPQGGFFGVGAQLAAGPALGGVMGQFGMTPFGLGHDQNVYDVLRARQFAQMQQQAMAFAARADAKSYYESMRGAAAVAGVPLGFQQRQAMGGLADALAWGSPLMAQIAPDFADRLGGTRGSATVMAARLADAGRYGLDPVTGRLGLSGASAGFLGERLYGDLYDGGAGPMRGLSAGQAGSLFGELQARGMAARGGDVRRQTARALRELGTDSPQRFASLAADLGVSAPNLDVGSLTPSDLDKFAGTADVQSRLRGFDAEKIKQSLKSYAGAVAAMRDIFGDLGKPNAPMQELMQGLEALTAGAASQLDAGRVGRIARQTYNLARQGGMTLDAAMVVQQHAAARAQAFGLDPVFAVNAAQGGIAFGSAYRALGKGAHTAWGAMTADQITQADVNLRVSAAASPLANQLAAAVRLSDAAGGFQAGSTQANLVAAVRAGMSRFQDANGNVVDLARMTEPRLVELLTAARGAGGADLNLSAGTVRDFFLQRATNREFVDKYDVGGLTRRLQGRYDVQPFFAGRMTESLTASLVAAGMDPEAARAAAGAAAGRSTDRFFGMGTEAFADREARGRETAAILAEELGGTQAGAFLGRMSADRRDAFLRTAAERYYGHAERALGASKWRGLGGLQNVQRLFDPETMAEAERQQLSARFEAGVQDALSPLGRGGVLARAVDAVRGAKPGDDTGLRSVLAAALGGTKDSDVAAALAGPLQEMRRRQDALAEAQERALASTDPAARAELLRDVEAKQAELRAQADDLARVAGDRGLLDGRSLTGADVDAHAAAGKRVRAGRLAASAFRDPKFGGLSAEELADVKAQTLGSDAEKIVLAAAHRAKWADTLGAAVKADGTVDKARLSGDAQAALPALARRMGLSEDALLRSLATPEGAAKFSQAVSQLEANDWYGANAADIHKTMTDAEAAAVALVRRQGADAEAMPDAIAAVRKLHPHLTDEGARGVEEAFLRRRRLGVSEAELARARARLADPNRAGGAAIVADKDAPHGVGYRLRDPAAQTSVNALATDEALAERERAAYEVTGEQAAAYAQAQNFSLEPSEAEVAEELRRDPSLSRGAAVAHARHRRRAKVDAAVRGERQLAARGAAEDYWQSAAGQAFRDDVGAYLGKTEDFAERLTASPALLRRYGAGGLASAKELRDATGRLQELAHRYAGGDVARLLQGGVGNLSIDTRSEGGADLARRVGQEVQDLQATIDRHAGALGGTAGAAGRQFAGSNEDEARRLLGFRAGQALTQAQQAELAKVAAEVGSLRATADPEVAKGDALRKARAGVGDLAGRLGISADDADRIIRGEAGQGPAAKALSADEAARHGPAKKAYDEAAGRAHGLAARKTRLEGELAALGPYDPNEHPNKTAKRKSLQEAIGKTEGELADANRAKEGALAAVAGDAKNRGVGAAEYLAGKGYISDASRDQLRRRGADRDKAAAEADQAVKARDKDVIAKVRADAAAAGKDPEAAEREYLAGQRESLVGAAGAADRLERLRRAEVAREGASEGDLFRQLRSAMGFAGGRALTGAEEQAVAGLRGAPGGRAAVKAALSSQEALRGFAADAAANLERQAKAAEQAGDKAGAQRLRAQAGAYRLSKEGGADVVLREYQDAAGIADEGRRDRALGELQGRLGIDTKTADGRRAWERFKDSADYQGQFRRMAGKGEVKEGMLADMLAQAAGAGARQDAARVQEITGTLRLDWENRTGDISAHPLHQPRK